MEKNCRNNTLITMRQGNLIVLFCSRNNGNNCFNWYPPVPWRTYPSASCLIPPFFATSNQILRRFCESEEIKEQIVRDTRSLWLQKLLGQTRGLTGQKQGPRLPEESQLQQLHPWRKISSLRWTHALCILVQTTVINLVKPYQGPPNPIS
jgi:hypothetical protein